VKHSTFYGRLQMVKCFYKTQAVGAQIVSTGKAFAVTFRGETLGHYALPASAAEDLANGTCSLPSSLGILEKISECSACGDLRPEGPHLW
jgi:hypothetical protein